jgi:ribosomal protein S18 acetylase RimI-like enzyme
MRFITVDDALYAEELELRFRVLREPLGHTRADVPFPFERESLHLVAIEPAGSVAGCVLFHPETTTSGRLFQMAVAPQLQGQHVGRALVRALEAELTQRGFCYVQLHARENVIPFYERLGYTVFGEPFVEVSVRHRHMQKSLPGAVRMCDCST